MRRAAPLLFRCPCQTMLATAPLINPAFILPRLTSRNWPWSFGLGVESMIACFFRFRASCLWLCTALRSAIALLRNRRTPSPPQDSGAAVRLTLQDAIDRARKNSTVFQAAATEAALSREDKNQARDALLPSVAYNASAIYSQGNGTGIQSVHCLQWSARVHQPGQCSSGPRCRVVCDVSGCRGRSQCGQGASGNRLRGLVVTVVQPTTRLSLAQKSSSPHESGDEGTKFLQLTQSLEHGGEVAHADVIKAELQANDRQRQLQEAKLALLNSRLDLAVLLFQTSLTILTWLTTYTRRLLFPRCRSRTARVA